MDTDATTLQKAVAVLRQRYGEQLAGSRQGTEAQMRGTLRQQLGLDDHTAGHVIEKLSESGRLTYTEGANAGTNQHATSGQDAGADDDAEGTGPVISMPGTLSGGGGGQIITAASPGMIMGVANEKGGDAESGLEEASVPVRAGDDEDAQGGGTQGHWRIA